MSKYGKKLKDAKYKKQTKEINRKFAEQKEQLLMQSSINDNSTKSTFLKWITECGNDLGIYEYSKSDIVLSCCGSDGYTIGETSINNIPYNNPVALDKWLESEGLYESFKSTLGTYNPPTIRYIDWINNMEVI